MIAACDIPWCRLERRCSTRAVRSMLQRNVWEIVNGLSTQKRPCRSHRRAETGDADGWSRSILARTASASGCSIFSGTARPHASPVCPALSPADCVVSSSPARAAAPDGRSDAAARLQCRWRRARVPAAIRGLMCCGTTPSSRLWWTAERAWVSEPTSAHPHLAPLCVILEGVGPVKRMV